MKLIKVIFCLEKLASSINLCFAFMSSRNLNDSTARMGLFEVPETFCTSTSTIFVVQKKQGVGRNISIAVKGH